MSDGTKFTQTQSSAGVAIMNALAEFPGMTVRRCYAGMTQAEVDAVQSTGDKDAALYMVGTEDFDIPEHEPMTKEDAKFYGKRPRRKDATELMFTEEEMKGQLQ